MLLLLLFFIKFFSNKLFRNKVLWLVKQSTDPMGKLRPMETSLKCDTESSPTKEVLIPETGECYVMWEEGLCRWNWSIPAAPVLSQQPLKSWELPSPKPGTIAEGELEWWGRRADLRDSREGDSQICWCCLWRWWGPSAKDCRKPLETENDPQPTTSQDTRPSIIQFHRTEFCHNQKVDSPGWAHAWFQSFVNKSIETIQGQWNFSNKHRNLQNCDIITLCCFKHFKVWQFLIQQW